MRDMVSGDEVTALTLVVVARNTVVVVVVRLHRVVLLDLARHTHVHVFFVLDRIAIVEFCVG